MHTALKDAVNNEIGKGKIFDPVFWYNPKTKTNSKSTKQYGRHKKIGFITIAVSVRDSLCS